jgi:hypothetical protein
MQPYLSVRWSPHNGCTIVAKYGKVDLPGQAEPKSDGTTSTSKCAFPVGDRERHQLCLQSEQRLSSVSMPGIIE